MYSRIVFCFLALNFSLHASDNFSNLCAKGLEAATILSNLKNPLSEKRSIKESLQILQILHELESIREYHNTITILKLSAQYRQKRFAEVNAEISLHKPETTISEYDNCINILQISAQYNQYKKRKIQELDNNPTTPEVTNKKVKNSL